MKGFSHYINGSYASSPHFTSGKTLYWNNELIDYKFSYLKKDESPDQDLLEAALQGAWETHQQILTGFFPLEERVQFLRELHHELEKSKESLAKILSFEIKKPITLAQTELDRSLTTIKECLNAANLFFSSTQQISKQALPEDLKSYHLLRQGKGPILCITPFNFPINLALHKIAPAILSGCPIVLKASPKAILSTACLVDQLHAAKIPAGMLNFIHCDENITNKICADHRIKLISFTGSAQVGWSLAQKYSKEMTLELGGNAPVYIDKSADLEKACQELCQSAFSFAGQVCISTQNIFIDQEVFDTARRLLLKHLQDFPVAPHNNPQGMCSEIIDQDSFHRIQDLLLEEKKRGATLHQLKSDLKLKHFIPPTFIENASPELYQKEVFAPLATLKSIAGFPKWAQTIHQQKNRLQCAFYSQNPEHHKKAQEIDFGGIIINKAPSTRIDRLPYGGQGGSGQNREGPLCALEFMNTWKTILNFSEASTTRP